MWEAWVLGVGLCPPPRPVTLRRMETYLGCAVCILGVQGASPHSQHPATHVGWSYGRAPSL